MGRHREKAQKDAAKAVGRSLGPESELCLGRESLPLRSQVTLTYSSSHTFLDCGLICRRQGLDPLPHPKRHALPVLPLNISVCLSLTTTPALAESPSVTSIPAFSPSPSLFSSQSEFNKKASQILSPPCWYLFQAGCTLHPTSYKYLLFLPLWI